MGLQPEAGGHNAHKTKEDIVIMEENLVSSSFGRLGGLTKRLAFGTNRAGFARGPRAAKIGATLATRQRGGYTS